MKKTLGACVAAAVAAGFIAGTATINEAQQAPGSVVVYTANEFGGSVSALDGETLSSLHGDVAAPGAPLALALSPDGSRLYVVTSNEDIRVIDTSDDSVVQSNNPNDEDSFSDVVVSPDGTRVYATEEASSSIEVYLPATNSFDGSLDVPTSSSSSCVPIAIDISPDGQSLYILCGISEEVIRMNSTTGALIDSVGVLPNARELKLSVDGNTVVVVGQDEAQFFAAATLDRITGGLDIDLGDQTDVAVAGSRAYVLNENLVPPPVGAKTGGPKGIITSGPSIDVYEMATGGYVTSHLLGFGSSVLGIAVVSDASVAYVSRVDAENLGSVSAVNLTTGTVGPTGSTGNRPRRIVAKESDEVIVQSFCLPRSLNLTLKGAGKDTLGATGIFDDGGFDVDYTQPVTIEVGGFNRTFTLIQKGPGKFVAPNSPQVTFQITPNLDGSSRAKFKLNVSKSTLAGSIDPNGAVTVHFRADGIDDAAGTVALTDGRYRIGKARGELTDPPFETQRARAKVGGQDADSFTFFGGFATAGATPATLADVLFEFGAFSRTIPGAQFVKNGDVFTFSSKVGASKFFISIDFLRERVFVEAKKVEIGDLLGTTDVVFDSGSGAGTVRNTIRFGADGANRSY